MSALSFVRRRRERTAMRKSLAGLGRRHGLRVVMARELSERVLILRQRRLVIVDDTLTGDEFERLAYRLEVQR